MAGCIALIAMGQANLNKWSVWIANKEISRKRKEQDFMIYIPTDILLAWFCGAAVVILFFRGAFPDEITPPKEENKNL